MITYLMNGYMRNKSVTTKLILMKRINRWFRINTTDDFPDFIVYTDNEFRSNCEPIDVYCEVSERCRLLSNLMFNSVRFCRGTYYKIAENDDNIQNKLSFLEYIFNDICEITIESNLCLIKNRNIIQEVPILDCLVWFSVFIDSPPSHSKCRLYGLCAFIFGVHFNMCDKSMSDDLISQNDLLDHMICCFLVMSYMTDQYILVSDVSKIIKTYLLDVI